MNTNDALPIALIESHAGLLIDLKRALTRLGYGVEAFADAGSAVAGVGSRPRRLIVADLDSPGVRDWLTESELIRDWPRILLAKSAEEVRLASLAADRIVWKPFAIRDLASAVHSTQMASENLDGLSSRRGDPMLETRDPSLLRTIERARRYAGGSASILITGEYGTGRLALAHAIHEWSARRGAAVIEFGPTTLSNCEGMQVWEAVDRLVGDARDGTLILSEPGDLSDQARKALVESLGQMESDRVPRLISVARSALMDGVALTDGDRELEYRLEGLLLTLPPLRDRVLDQEVIFESILRRVSRELGRATPEFTNAMLQELVHEGFPGNRMGLESRLRQILIATPGSSERMSQRMGAEVRREPKRGIHPVSLDLKTLERDTIIRALAHWDGNRTHASESLGISVRTLRNKIRDYGLR